MVKTKCDFCGKSIEKTTEKFNRSKRHFCDNICSAKAFKGVNASGFFKKGNIEGRCINYKDGKQRANGYIMVLSHKHPHRTKKGYVYEHRLVMEKHLGRYLGKCEVIHHIDGDKLNNSINNLMLLPTTGAHTRYHNSLK